MTQASSFFCLDEFTADRGKVLTVDLTRSCVRRRGPWSIIAHGSYVRALMFLVCDDVPFSFMALLLPAALIRLSTSS